MRQNSADAAVAYLLTSTLQIDMGANIGLNRVTPDMQVYAGVSTRFWPLRRTVQRAAD